MPGSDKSFFVYILKCADDSLYVGHSSDALARVEVHNQGRGALWTAKRLPVVLIYCEACDTEQRAVAREQQIKRWTRAKKLALAKGDRAALHRLARRQN